MKYLTLTLLLLTSFACKESEKQPEIFTQSMYIGAYTRAEGHVNGKAEGIGHLTYNSETGEILSQKILAKVTNPSFLVKDSKGQNVYAVSELAQEGEQTGYIHAFQIISRDSLLEIGKYPTNGRAPCHVSIDKTGSIVFVANYLDATVTVYNRQDNGSLVESQIVYFEGKSVNASRQEAPHIHNVALSPDNKKVFVADLGSDKIWLFDLEVSSGKITPAQQSYVASVPGSGPRHIALKSNDAFYVINELNSTISFMQKDKNGFRIEQNISTEPEGFSGNNYCADIKLHPNRKFLYGSNRGHDSIVAYKIEADGRLTLIDYYTSGGKFPRNFDISPDGNQLIVANQNSDNLLIYNIDEASGKLNLLSEIKNVMTPVCVVI